MDRQGESQVDIYAVGWLADLLYLGRGVRRRNRHAIGFALRRFRQEARFTATRVREGNWRAVKNSFNGYLAEPTPWPAGLRRCGTGWTKRRAMRSLRRHGYREVC